MWYFIGLASGLLLTLPLAAFAAWRTARRVRHLEQRALATQRLAELGTLTGGLAHEIKNPLSTVGLNIQLLQEDLESVISELASESDERIGRVKRRFESLSRETGRLREILEDFLQFAGRVKLDRAPTDVHDLIDEIADFFEPQAHAANVHLRTQLSAPQPKLDLDRGLFKQSLLNLMINACQAMAEARNVQRPSGGNDELIIRTQRTGALVGNGDLQIHVIDTGPGMDAETAGRIFQPYFSRKRGGTGLGLSTARRIIEEHGGSIVVHSEPGRGSDFVITLPLRETQR